MSSGNGARSRAALDLPSAHEDIVTVLFSLTSSPESLTRRASAICGGLRRSAFDSGRRRRVAAIASADDSDDDDYYDGDPDGDPGPRHGGCRGCG